MNDLSSLASAAPGASPGARRRLGCCERAMPEGNRTEQVEAGRDPETMS
jgi:hypothetical protein